MSAALPSAPIVPGRVLVTGGAGFIGAEVVGRLLEAGTSVVVVDRVPDVRRVRAAAELRGRGADLVVADLADLDLTTLLRSVDAVVHLAGRPGVQTSWGDGFALHLDDNVEVSHRLFEAALGSSLRRIVVASSSSVYGDVPTGFADESTPHRPLSPYGVAKASVELLAGAYAVRGLPIVGLRYFTVYGRRQRPDMAVSRLLDAASSGPPFALRGDGRQVRDLTHVDDVARATVAALGAPIPPGTMINVGSGRPIALRELVELVGRVVGSEVPIAPAPAASGDPARTAADVTLAADLLGWRPEVGLLDGLSDQARHHRTFELAGAGRG